MSTSTVNTGAATPDTVTDPATHTAAKPATLPRIAGPRPDRPVGLGRLIGVEWRKQVDTRAGLWLLISIGLVVAAIMVIMLFVEQGNHSYGDYFAASALPLSILVPLVGVMAATAEWSQRTGLTTFALEPRRGRVVLAKTLASLVTAGLAFALALVLGAGMHQVAISVRDADPAWDLTWGLVGGLALMLALSLAQGVGFGLSLLNTPAAIVAYLVLPTVWSILGGLISWLQTPAQWLDLGSTMEPLLENSMTGEQWAHLGTASLVWVALPLAIGLWRVVRAEVK
jgi:ABC-2 type transport system permease protein